MSTYGTSQQSGILACIFTFLVSHITGYNHDKYWLRRSYVMDSSKKNVIKKIYYIYYLKKVDSKHLSSSGFSYNVGSQFVTPPLITAWI